MTNTANNNTAEAYNEEKYNLPHSKQYNALYRIKKRHNIKDTYYSLDKLYLNDRIAVAADPSTAPAVLAKLASDSVYGVRLAVARNPNTPPDALEQLTHDTDEEVQEAAEAEKASKQ